LVSAAHRRHYTVDLDDGDTLQCVLRGRGDTVACGDQVDVEPGGAREGVIVAVKPRQSLCYRSDAHRQKLIAANVTQVLGIVAPDPPYDDELAHRWSIAAESSGCRFVLIANKADLADFERIEPRLAQFTALGYPVVRLCARHDADALRPWLRGQHSVLVGQSGMGKSTLVNTLLPGADARIGALSPALRSGRHTTTQTTLYRLDADSWIVDSPGMQAFGLAHLDDSSIEHAFVELRPLLGQCRYRDCRHDAEPGCAVRAAVERGEVFAWRVALLQQMRADSVRRARHWE
jgi:ribosome biogenesis GTPase